jgi:hypothetical protein
MEPLRSDRAAFDDVYLCWPRALAIRSISPEREFLTPDLLVPLDERKLLHNRRVFSLENSPIDPLTVSKKASQS